MNRLVIPVFILLTIGLNGYGQNGYSYDTTALGFAVDFSQIMKENPTDENPRFPGCEEKGLNKRDLDKCSQARLLDFIGSNLVYPRKARRKGTQGMVIVSYYRD